MVEGLLAVYYLTFPMLEEPMAPYGEWLEEVETEELLAFVKRAREEVVKRGFQMESVPKKIRITASLRVYIGNVELKVRPMVKTVLLLFLRHPEGIVLKDMLDYQDELGWLYRRVSRSSNPAEIEKRVMRMVDLFNNDLNVSIARVNKAVASLVEEAEKYQIGGVAGQTKKIQLDRNLVIWE